jgi:hypothetical protein
MTANRAATDAGVGRAMLSTRIKLTASSILVCLQLGAIPGLLAPVGLWAWKSSPQSFDVVKLHIQAALTPAENARVWRMRDDAGERKIISIPRAGGPDRQVLKPAQMLTAIEPLAGVWSQFQWLLKISPLTAVLGYVGLWALFHRVGEKSQERRRTRGAFDQVEAKELDAMVRQRTGSVPRYRFAQVGLPPDAPMKGLLAVGAQRSGKSLAIHDLMTQVFSSGRKCIILDQSGEFYRAHFRPGKDFFFNPAMEGSVPWSLFRELKYSYHADQLAQAFLPSKEGAAGAGKFFEDAARSLFSVILLRLRQRGAVNTSDIAHAILSMPDDEMDKLVADSVASSAIGGESKPQRQGVIASIAIYLNGLAAVQPGDWTVREFLERDDDARFFIVNSDDTKAMFSPLFRLLLVVAFGQIAALQQTTHEDRYWFFLDEVFQFGDIRLDDALATLGKFGVAVVCGFQAESQVEESLGQARARTVLNCFNTVLQLRANDEAMQEKGSKRLGAQDEEIVQRNTALAVSDWRDGAGLTVQERQRVAVLPSEIGQLDPLTGFLRLAGSYPVARVDYRSWLPRRPGAKARANDFAARQPMPPRNPIFEIVDLASPASAAPTRPLGSVAAAAAAGAAAVGTTAVAAAATGTPEDTMSEFLEEMDEERRRQEAASVSQTQGLEASDLDPKDLVDLVSDHLLNDQAEDGARAPEADLASELSPDDLAKLLDLGMDR